MFFCLFCLFCLFLYSQMVINYKLQNKLKLQKEKSKTNQPKYTEERLSFKSKGAIYYQVPG